MYNLNIGYCVFVRFILLIFLKQVNFHYEEIEEFSKVFATLLGNT